MFLTVDLASKFSASVLRNRAGEVLWQGDSGGLSASRWVFQLRSIVETYSPEHILVEDVPYGVSSQAMTKPVTRLQGMLILALEGREFYFINPSTWQKRFEGVGRAPKGMTKTESAKYRIAKAEEHARSFGYIAPDLVKRWQDRNPDLKPLKKYTNPLDKQRTDYCDAFLMNVWLEEHEASYKTLSGVQPPLI